MTTKSMMEHFNEICEVCDSLMMPMGEPEGTISFECMECRDKGLLSPVTSAAGADDSLIKTNTQTTNDVPASFSPKKKAGALLQEIKDHLDCIFQETKNPAIEAHADIALDIIELLGHREAWQEVMDRND